MDTASLDYVIAGGAAYVRGNAAFWTTSGLPAATATSLGQSKKWIKAPASEFSQFTEQASFAGLIKELFAQSGSANALTSRVAATTVGGVACWEITDRFSGEDAKLDIAQDTFLPVRVAGTDAGQPQSLVFDQWNSAPVATAPATSEITSPS